LGDFHPGLGNSLHFIKNRFLALLGMTILEKPLTAVKSEKAVLPAGIAFFLA
jgi:hypothetical protein